MFIDIWIRIKRCSLCLTLSLPRNRRCQINHNFCYPDNAKAIWAYEPTRDLLARVTNTINGTDPVP